MQKCSFSLFGSKKRMRHSKGEAFWIFMLKEANPKEIWRRTFLFLFKVKARKRSSGEGKKKSKAAFHDMYCSLLGLIIGSEHFSKISPPAVPKGKRSTLQSMPSSCRKVRLCLRLVLITVLLTSAGRAAWGGAAGGAMGHRPGGYTGWWVRVLTRGWDRGFA